MLPGNFQVYAKIDEESRKDSTLVASFLLTLNEARGSVTYEFRGACNIKGSSADFESIMEAHKESRIPRILDIVYQRLYPVVFMLAGMTTSTYPQSIALLTEMVSNEPIQVHQEAEAIPKPEEKQEKPIVENAKPEAKPTVHPAPEIEASKPTMTKIKKPQPTASSDKLGPAKV